MGKLLDFLSGTSPRWENCRISVGHEHVSGKLSDFYWERTHVGNLIGYFLEQETVGKIVGTLSGKLLDFCRENEPLPRKSSNFYRVQETVGIIVGFSLGTSPCWGNYRISSGKILLSGNCRISSGKMHLSGKLSDSHWERAFWGNYREL